MSSEYDYIKTSVLAKACGVRLATIRTWIDQGRIQCVKTPGGHRRVKRCDAIAFLRAHNFAIPDYIAGSQA